MRGMPFGNFNLFSHFVTLICAKKPSKTSIKVVTGKNAIVKQNLMYSFVTTNFKTACPF